MWCRYGPMSSTSTRRAPHFSPPCSPPSGSDRAAAATDDQRLWLLDSITDALEDRAQRAPVAVIVDDAQWADPATLFVLRTLPGRLASSRILWVLAVRSDTERPTVARVREDSNAWEPDG